MRQRSSLRRDAHALGRALLTAGALVATALAGSATAPPASASQLTRLVVPPDGETYFGFSYRLWDSSDPGWGDTRPFSARIADSIQNELAGKTPTFLNVWQGWQAADVAGKPMKDFDSALGDIATVKSITGPDSVVFLDWTLTSTTATNGGVTLKDITSGSLDDYIRTCALEIKAYGQPLLIRLFGGEFNGSWWYGQSPLANPSLTTADFVAAWRRVVNIFRQVGALNASWAWIPNAHPVTPVPWMDSNIAAYYPGDDYVDWAGADIYDIQPVSDLDSSYAFAVEHAKPFFIAEWGVRLAGSTLTPPEQQAWIGAMFDYVESHPAIKAISYFNEDYRIGAGQPLDPDKIVSLDNGQVTYQRDTNDGDTRLLAQSGADFQGAYARRISNPRYISATLSEQVGPVVEATANVTLRTPLYHAHAVMLRWRGNATARSYDVAVRRPGSAWRIVAGGVRVSHYTLHGARGATELARLRARDQTGKAGPWTRAQRVRFR
jgi:beta-mannanase